MGWLDKLLGRKKTGNENGTSAPIPESAQVGKPFAGLEGVRFGRYSDNNKSYKRNQSWFTAEDRYKEKNYMEAFVAFFDYLCDEEEQNVVFTQDGKTFSFELVQGSKRVTGNFNGERLVATVPLAIMEKPSTAVMRRLLELNYTLYYTRCALEDDNTLCMVFDTIVQMASPNKLYYGLKELATKADRQDDMLLVDFTALKPVGMEHIVKPGAAELEVKYAWFRKWIQEMLDRISGLNADSFSGAVAYCLLVLLYRIDFLITPEAKLLAEVERISSLYWDKKDEIALVERNAMLKEAITKLLDLSLEEFSASIYHSKATFGVAAPGPSDKMRENIVNANKDAQWYVENKYPEIALTIGEYGPVFNQWTFSVPRVHTDIVTIYMAVVHADYFKALGLKEPFYEPETQTFHKELIIKAIDEAIAKWPEKYVDLKWDQNKLKWDTLFEFGVSITEIVANLNLETRR